MKLAVKDFKSALTLFEGSLIDAQDSDAKAGILTGLFAMKSDDINKGIDAIAKDGFVETDSIRKFLDGWLSRCGGNIELTPKIPQALLAFLELVGVKLDKFVVSKAQVDSFFNEMIPAANSSAIQ